MNRSSNMKKATPKKSPKARKSSVQKQQKHKLHSKKSTLSTTTSSSSSTKLALAQTFRKTRPSRGLWDTPQDEPGSKPEQYVDFFKDTPVNSLAGQLVRDMRDFFLVQTGGPQFFDRDFEQQKLSGEENFKAYKKQMLANNYAGFQGYDEMDFNTGYYTRVNQTPITIGSIEPELRLNPNHPLHRTSPSHLLQHACATDPAYLDHREIVAQYTGYIAAGPDFVPRTKFQFPIMSVENDFLFFHD